MIFGSWMLFPVHGEDRNDITIPELILSLTGTIHMNPYYSSYNTSWLDVIYSSCN